MNTRLRTLTAGFFAILLAACTAGPTGDDPGVVPDVEAGLHQGVTLLDLQPDFSFTAAFRKGDDVIYLQALRGAPTPDEYRNTPGYPQHEIDARVTDEDGRILYVRQGGDDFIDPTWADDLVWADSLPPRRTPNGALFEMIPEAMEAVEAEVTKRHGASAAVSVASELAAVRDFGRTAREVVAASELEVLERVESKGFLGPEVLDALDADSFIAGGGGTEGPEDAPKYFISGWYKLSLHDDGGGLGTYRHSATRIHQLRVSGVYSYYDFCNHGTCAGSMGQKCALSQVHKPAWTALTCNTGYSAKSQDGGHNCHDDSRVQMAAFIFGPTMARNQYWCNDGNHACDISNNFWYGDQEGSPNCDDSTNRGYNHPDMQAFWASNTNSAQQNTANFNIILSAGATYDIYTCGHASGDTYLRLFDAAGNQVSANDDNCSSLQSYLTFTAPATGTYQVRAGCFGSGSCNGKVRVRLAGTTTSPPSTFYSAENTNSAQQNTRNFYYYLSAGYTYTFTTCGNTETDTYLRLKTYAGAEVAYNDDDWNACPAHGTASTIRIPVTSSGSYYIHAGCFGSGSCSGVVTQSSVVTPISSGDPVKATEEIYYY